VYRHLWQEIRNGELWRFYTAKGVAALLVPLANVLAAATGSWTAVFAVASALNIVAAALALIALKPARIRAMAKRSSPYPSIN
jgi:OFA family oxalate/formate antiporter-like MFS transporter